MTLSCSVYEYTTQIVLS